MAARRIAWRQRAKKLLVLMPKERWLNTDEIAHAIAPIPFDRVTKEALARLHFEGLINRTHPDLRLQSSLVRHSLRYWVPKAEQTAARPPRLCLRCRREFIPDHRWNYLCRPNCGEG